MPDHEAVHSIELLLPGRRRFVFQTPATDLCQESQPQLLQLALTTAIQNLSHIPEVSDLLLAS